MPQLLIRDISENLNAALEASAEAARRSKEKQALFLLEIALHSRKSAREILDEAKRVREQWKGKPATMDEILKATEEAH